MERLSKKTVSELSDWLEEQKVPAEVIESFQGMGKYAVMTCSDSLAV